MSSETVVLCYHSPMGIDGFRTLVTWPNSISPVIFICKTSAWPAKVWYFYLFQCIHNIHPDPVFPFQCGSITYPETIIDTAAKMLGKMTIDMTADGKIRISSHYNSPHIVLCIAEN